MFREVTTRKGHKFLLKTCVKIGDVKYDIDDLNEKQRAFVSGKLSEQRMNAIFAGRAVFKAEGIPTLEEAFGKR